MTSAILYACGVINAAFLAFHVLLGLSIQRLTALTAGQRALLQAFNTGGAVMIAFLAVAFLACQADLRTRLGRATILLGAATYLVRALDEFIFFPRVGWAIVTLCTLAGLLHLAALAAARRPGALLSPGHA